MKKYLVVMLDRVYDELNTQKEALEAAKSLSEENIEEAFVVVITHKIKPVSGVTVEEVK